MADFIWGDVVKILLVNGSPKKEGATSFLLQKVMGSVNGEIEEELINLVDFNLKFCKGCDNCVREKKCAITDDDLGKFAEKLQGADAIVLGSPSYGGGMTALMKNAMDRTRYLRMDDFKLKDKFASFVSTSGLKIGGQETVFQGLMQFATLHGMIIVGNANDPISRGPFPAGSLQRDNKKFTFVKEDLIAVEDCEALGKRLSEVLNKFNANI